MPEISIIVPVYKAEQYLDRCIQSILKQTFTDFELILIEDGSPDKSGELCDEWAKRDARIKVIHQENAGAGAARNAGLQIAKGNYIGFVDSDDWVEPVMYEVLHDAIVDNSAQLATVGMISRKSYNGVNYKKKAFPTSRNNQKEVLERFFRIHGEDATINSVCIKLIDRNVLEKFLFIEGTINEDVRANFYFITHSNTIVMIDAPLYNYFQNYSGVTKSCVTEKEFEYIKTYKDILTIVEQKYPDFKYFAYINYIRSKFTILSKMRLYGYDKNNKQLAKKYYELKKVVRQNFWQLMKWNMPLSRKILLILVCL